MGHEVIVCTIVALALLVFGFLFARPWWRNKKDIFTKREHAEMFSLISSRIKGDGHSQGVTITSSGYDGIRFELSDKVTPETRRYLHTLCTQQHPLERRLEKSDVLEYKKKVPPIHPKIGFALLIGGAVFIALAFVNLVMAK